MKRYFIKPEFLRFQILTNFLSSVMIHATRPFVLNEWIQTKIEGYEVSGTVEVGIIIFQLTYREYFPHVLPMPEHFLKTSQVTSSNGFVAMNLQHVGWWSPTIIRGEDREAIHIPNHKFTVNVVRNLTQKTHWRIKTHLAISHLDVNKINVRFLTLIWLTASHEVSLQVIIVLNLSRQNIVADMRKVLAKNPQVEQQRLHRRIFLENVNPENQALVVRLQCLFLLFYKYIEFSDSDI